MNELREQVDMIREHQGQWGEHELDPEVRGRGQFGSPHPQPGAAYADYSRIKKCPIWALVRQLEGRAVGSDRCNPGCHIFLGEEGDCSFKVIARWIRRLVDVTGSTAMPDMSDPGQAQGEGEAELVE